MSVEYLSIMNQTNSNGAREIEKMAAPQPGLQGCKKWASIGHFYLNRDRGIGRQCAIHDRHPGRIGLKTNP
jgi:hypothetical protein